MVQSAATTVAQYLAELSPERRATIAAVLKVVRSELPKGYRETMNWGMISYEVPLATYPSTYNGKPLSYAALASQKNYCSLYLSCVYQDGGYLKTLQQAFKAAGLKLDMGKSCIRFREASDLPLEAIGKIIAAVSPEKFIAIYEQARGEKPASSTTRKSK